MSVNIPLQLQNPAFRFVKLGPWNQWKNPKTGIFKQFGAEEYTSLRQENVWKPQGKAPQEPDWQKTNNYAFDDSSLLDHPHNLGVIGGHGDLRILDIDNRDLAEKLLKELDTFTVKTGSQGYHFYFISPHTSNHVLRDKMGEWRADRYQVVIPGSRHPNGNFYEVVKNLPIKSLTEGQTLDIIGPYLRTQTPIEHLQPEGVDIPPLDRSREEMKAICSFIMRGLNQNQVYEQMNQFVKWKEGTPQYRELTYKKALDWVINIKTHSKPFEDNFTSSKEDIEIQNWNDSFYTDLDLQNYTPPSQEYLATEFIPKGQIGIFVGYSGERKTFVALHTALCLASAQPVFGVIPVPQKCKVLVIDEENGKAEIGKRVQSLKTGMGLTEPLDISYLSFFNSKLDNPTKQKRIVSYIESFRPDLIIVDCLQRVLSIDIDKENQLLSEFFTSFVRPVVQKYGCSWIFVHHYRKRDHKTKNPNMLDEIRGASELRNYVRFAWGVQRPGKVQNENVDTILIKQLKMSNAPSCDDRVISFSNNQDGSLLIKFEGMAEEVLNTTQLCMKAIKQWMVDENLITFKTSEVLDAEPGGYKNTTIKTALNKLVSSGVLSKPGKGVYELVGNIQEEENEPKD